jgi:hypothetical protein
MREIYGKVCASRSCAPILKKRIEADLNEAGIVGLSDPPEWYRPKR